MSKLINFSVFTLVIEEDSFTFDSFAAMREREGYLPVADDGLNSTQKLWVAKTNPFIAICLEEGKGMPRPKKVYNVTNLREENNPRRATQVEMSTQIFVLIDSSTQRIYISNAPKKKTIANLLSEELDSAQIDVQYVINRQEFLDNLDSLKSIELCLDKSISNAEGGDLSEILSDNAYGFGPDVKRLKLRIELKEGNLAQVLIGKIEDLWRQKESKKLDKLKIVGYNEQGLEQVMNTDKFVEKITIESTVMDDGLYNRDSVFKTLIATIREQQ